MGAGGRMENREIVAFLLSSYYVPDMVLSTHLRNIMCLVLDMLSLR